MERSALRTGILLGAGSSRDAGLPLTNQLAEMLVRQINEDVRGVPDDVRGALNFVYGAMIGHASDAGENPLAAVNVEKLFSAVRLLQARNTHEAASFVESWKPAIARFDSSESRRSDRDLMGIIGSSLMNGSTGSMLVSMIREISLAGISPGDGSVFKKLNDELMIRTCRILADIKSVDYLNPIMQIAQEQDGGLDIATLNYDLTVETAAALSGVGLSTGIEEWHPGSEIELETTRSHINLLKLHGSVDWARHASPEDPTYRRLHSFEVRRLPAGTVNRSPVMVIGDREKLETDGPTLPLLSAFERMLRRTDRLVVVGYSFADEHINRLVRAWLNGEAHRTIVVLDPGWPMPQDFNRYSNEGFRAQLLRLAVSTDFAHYGDTRPSRPVRARVIRESAKAGLGRALELADERTNLSVQAVLCNDGSTAPTLRLVNRGRPLTSVNLYVYSSGREYSTQAIRWLSGPDSRPDSEGLAMPAAHAATFNTGDVFEVQVELNARRTDNQGRLNLRGENEVEYFELDLEFETGKGD
jgi:hypothetical protein